MLAISAALGEDGVELSFEGEPIEVSMSGRLVHRLSDRATFEGAICKGGARLPIGVQIFDPEARGRRAYLDIAQAYFRVALLLDRFRETSIGMISQATANWDEWDILGRLCVSPERGNNVQSPL